MAKKPTYEELEQRVEELEKEALKRRQAGKELRESEKQYKLATSAGKVGVWDWNIETNEIYLDPNLKAMLGYADHEIRNHLDDWGKYVHPDDAELVMAEANAHLEGLKPYYEVVHRMLHKDGSIRWFLARGTATRDADGKPYRMVGTDTDITEHKRAEKALRESEERYRAVVEDQTELICRFLPDGTLTFVNQAYCHYFGKKQEELVGYSWMPFIPEENRESVRQQMASLSLENPIVTYEHRVILPDRQIRWQQWSDRAIFDEQDRLVEYQSVGRDITERKQVESELQMERDKLTSVFESMADGVYIVNKDHDIQYVNPVLKKDFGSAEGKKCHEYFHNSDEPCTFCKNEDVFAGKTVRWEWTSAKNGRTYDLIDTPIINSDGSISKLEIFRDITERKLVEETLRKSEEKYRMLVEQAKDGIVMLQDGKIKFANSNMAEMVGYTVEELLDSSFNGHIAPDELPRVADMYRQRMKNEAIPSIYESAILHKDGSRLEVEFNAGVTTYKGEPVDLVIVRDITERKQAEEALQYRVEFERLITGISTHFINLEPDKVDSGINRALQEIGEFAHVDRSYVFLFYDNKTKVDNTHEWCTEGIEPQIHNLQGLPSETIPWWMERLNRLENIHILRVADLPPEANAEKEILQAQDIQSVIVVPIIYCRSLIGFLGFDSVQREKTWSEDIIALLRIVGEVIANALARKQAEEALLESEKRYRTLFESSRDAIMVLTPEKKFLQGNPAAIKMFACADEKEFISHTVEDLSPEYQLDGTLTSEKTEQMMKIAIEEGSHFFEWKHKRIDGTEFFATVLLTKMETKNKIVMQATVRDITERKRAAEQLSRHIEQINKHKLALQKLAKMDFADLDAAIKSATEEASQTLGADRVCVWFFNEDQSEMVCQDLYQLSHDSHEKGLTLKSKDYPNYFRVLKEKGTIAADDAQNDPSTNELTEGYLKPLGITSRLSVAIFLQSDLVGGVSAEHTGPLRKWSEEEQTFLISIADVVTLALEIARRQQAELELKKHKYRLEELVEERTAELKEEISGRKKTEEELQRNVEDLERFSKLAVGREERMIKLKKEINEVLRGLGKPDKYKIVD